MITMYRATHDYLSEVLRIHAQSLHVLNPWIHQDRISRNIQDRKTLLKLVEGIQRSEPFTFKRFFIREFTYRISPVRLFIYLAHIKYRKNYIEKRMFVSNL